MLNRTLKKKKNIHEKLWRNSLTPANAKADHSQQKGQSHEEEEATVVLKEEEEEEEKEHTDVNTSFYERILQKLDKERDKKKSLSGKVISDLWRPEPNPVEMPSTTATKHRQQKGNNETPVKPLSTRDDCSPSLKLLVTLLGWNRLTTGNRENTFNRRTATVETLLECLPSK